MKVLSTSSQESLLGRAANWLERDRRSPSGGNSQPWAVEVKTEFERILIRVSIDPQYTHSPSTVDLTGYGAAAALGIFAQSLILAAGQD